MGNELIKAPVTDEFVSYPWENMMPELLLPPNSSNFLSILILPNVLDKVAIRDKDVEDTLAKAIAWLDAAQASGVPIIFKSVQTESLLTKISGEADSSIVNAGSLSDLSNVANSSLYGFKDRHGVDIGVVRAVRLWYAPIGGEFSIEIQPKKDSVNLGFSINRTKEGFIFISSVIDDGQENVLATLSRLNNLYKEAKNNSRLLVISRVSNQRVLPRMVSSKGDIRCYDLNSLTMKLDLHRVMEVSILLHFFLLDQSWTSSSGRSTILRLSP